MRTTILACGLSLAAFGTSAAAQDEPAFGFVDADQAPDGLVAPLPDAPFELAAAVPAFDGPGAHGDVPPAAPPFSEDAPELGLVGDIVVSDDEALLDLAADAELTWELVLDALLELEYDLAEQLYRHPDQNWIRVDDLWLAVEPVPYLEGDWSRVRVRVGDFITDIDRGWAEVLLLQIAHRFDERLLETLVGEADLELEDDERFTALGPLAEHWVDPGGVPHDLGAPQPDEVVPALTVDLSLDHDCYDGFGYGFDDVAWWGMPWVLYDGFGGPIASWGWSSFGGWPYWDVAFGYGLPLLWLGDPWWYHGHHHHDHHHDDIYDDHYGDALAFGGSGPAVNDPTAGIGPFDDVVSEFDDDAGEDELGTVVVDDPIAPDPSDGRGRFVDVGGERPGFIGRPRTRTTTRIPIARRGPTTPSSVTRRTLYTPQGTRIITLEGPRTPSVPVFTSTARDNEPTSGLPRTSSSRRDTSTRTTLPRVTSPTSTRSAIQPRTGSTPRVSVPRTSTPRASAPKTSKPKASKPKASTSSRAGGKRGRKN